MFKDWETTPEQARIAELFHRLWGLSRQDNPQRPDNYDKKAWMELQSLLNKLGVPV